MSLEVFLPLQFLSRIGICFSKNFWQNSPVKLWGVRLLFIGEKIITVSISTLVICLFIFSVSSWFSLIVFQLPSRVQLFVTPWTAARQGSLSLTIPESLPKFMSIPYVHSISSFDTLFSFSLQSFLASGTFPMSQLFASDDPNTGVSTSASNEYSGLISFKIAQFDLLAVQGTLRSLLQDNSKMASMCWRSGSVL